MQPSPMPYPGDTGSVCLEVDNRRILLLAINVAIAALATFGVIIVTGAQVLLTLLAAALFTAAFLKLAASLRQSVEISAKGVTISGLSTHRTYPWDEIENIELAEAKGGTAVALTVPNAWVALPTRLSVDNVSLSVDDVLAFVTNSRPAS